MTIYEFREWRYRLGLSQTAAAELLGVHRVTLANWELGKNPILAQTRLAALACELAYIAADQYVKNNPSPSHNYSHKNHVEALGRIAIRERFINDGLNNQKNPLLITIPSKSLIHFNSASAKQENEHD